MKRELWIMIGAAEDDVRTILRAKVMTIAEMWSLPGDYEIWVKCSDVLALLDGSSDG